MTSITDINYLQIHKIYKHNSPILYQRLISRSSKGRTQNHHSELDVRRIMLFIRSLSDRELLMFRIIILMVFIDKSLYRISLINYILFLIESLFGQGDPPLSRFSSIYIPGVYKEVYVFHAVFINIQNNYIF